MWKPSTTTNDVLMHSAKGTSWKKTNHKYVAIKNGRYIYGNGKNKAGTTVTGPKEKSSIKKEIAVKGKSQKHGSSTYQNDEHGHTYKRSAKKGSAGEFKDYREERNKEGRSAVRQQLNAATNKSRAEGDIQRREAEKKAKEKRHLKYTKLKAARHKGTVQERKLKKPTIKDQARNFMHEGDIKYKRFMKGLKKKFKWK